MLSVSSLLIYNSLQLLVLILLSLPAWHARGNGRLANRMAWGASLSLIGMLLISQSGGLPNVLTMVVANAMLVAGNRVNYRQIYDLFNMPRTARWERAVPVIGMSAYVLFWLADPAPGQGALGQWRVLSVAIPFAVSALYLLRRLHTRLPQPWSLGTRYVAVNAGVTATINILRVLIFLTGRGPSDPMHSSGALAVVLWVQFASLLMAFGLILELESRARAHLSDANEKLHRDVITDSLTGLGNRRHFELAAITEIDRARRHAWPITVMLIDVDHFKLVNDRWGHVVGDAVLCHIAKRCMHGLRSHDVLARWGGEEFALLLPHCNAELSHGVARRLLSSVRDAAMIEIGDERVTVSIGVATIEPSDATIATALQRADVALYQAKRTGRDRHVLALVPTPDTTTGLVR